MNRKRLDKGSIKWHTKALWEVLELTTSAKPRGFRMFKKKRGVRQRIAWLVMSMMGIFE